MQSADCKDMQRAAVTKRIFDFIICFGGNTQRHRADHSGCLRVILQIVRELCANPLPAKFRCLQK